MYPAMLNITNRLVTVIGGGEVSHRKVMTFLKFGAKVKVVSPDFVEELLELDEQIERITEPFAMKHLEKSFIVVAATDDFAVNEAVGKYCEAEGILCNVVTHPHLSSFIVPAHVCRGDLTISISTNGKSPTLARKIKGELETRYDEGYIEYLEILGRLRERILQNVEKSKEKKALLNYITTLNLEELKAYETSDITC